MSPPQTSSSDPSEISLSVSETNKLRAKLGLPLLDLNEGKNIQHQDNDHSPPQQDEASSSQMRLKLSKMKRNRDHLKKWKQHNSNKNASSLGDDDDEPMDDVNVWVSSHKDASMRRGGISRKIKRRGTSTTSLTASDELPSGMRVRHDKKFIEKGKETILTLRDQNILDANATDELENVSLVTQEKNTWNEKKRRGEGLYAYVESLEENNDVDVLPKYDEAQMANVQTKSFELKSTDNDNESRRDNATLVTLNNAPEKSVASDVLTIEEMKKRRKKKKSKRSMRKRKRESVEESTTEGGTTAVPQDATSDVVYATQVNVAERKTALLEQEKQRRLAYNTAMQKAQDVSNLRLTAMEDDLDADNALLKLERRRKRRRVDNAPPGAPVNVIDRTKSLEQKVKQEEPTDDTEGAAFEGAEFLPDIGAPEEETTAIGALREQLKTKKEEEQDEAANITIASRRSKSSRRQTQAQDLDNKDAGLENEIAPLSTVLLEEPILDRGLYKAIMFARQKGILKKFSAREEEARTSRDTVTIGVDSRREEFKKLNYAFYGMRKSKSKLEKEKKKKQRIKRVQQMSATDTPFNAAQALRNAQEASGSAFVQIGRSLDALSTAAAAYQLSKQKRKAQEKAGS